MIYLSVRRIVDNPTGRGFRMTIGVGILAGGQGKRLKQNVPKAEAPLYGRPM